VEFVVMIGDQGLHLVTKKSIPGSEFQEFYS
jgi:hypothetical protein